MSRYFTYTNLPEHQVAIYHDERVSMFDDGERKPENRTLSLLVTGLFTLLIVLTFPISAFFCIKVLRDYERAVIFRLGRLIKPKGPGVILIIPCLDNWTRVDMRSRAFNVPPQKVHTKDDGWVMVGADVQFRIRDAVLSQTAIQNLNQSLRSIAQTSLSNCVARRTVPQAQGDRKFINIEVKDGVNKMAGKWGAEVERVQMSDVQVLKEPRDTGGVDIAQMFSGGQNAALANILQGLFPGVGNQVSIPTGNNTTRTDTSVLTPAQLVTLVQGVLEEDMTSRIGGTYLFDITGENGGTWIMDLSTVPGSIRATDKLVESPDVTFSMSVDEMVNIFYGQVTPFNSYMQGGLKVDGDLKMAMNLETIIDKLRQGRRNTPMNAGKDKTGAFVV
ncbi:predicted protein [Nematostella vectensis]|uniref:Band 7 domain-containing protein n=1 Tax=Nematostella vectensis TaxID=45351 RepID=A7SVP0_NEMVE|nr:predicted protein [Nematostella vectensis]|eukprot:XP_001624331.1 predicted protein [Nematostella vectensis]